MINECKAAGIHVAHVDMGTGHQTIVRGVNIGGRLPWQSADADGEEDNFIFRNNPFKSNNLSFRCNG